MKLLPLTRVLAEEPNLVEPFLGRAADPDRHPFTALNTAFLADGAVLVVPKGVVLEEPIHLLHVSAAGLRDGVLSPALVLPRTLVVLGEASQATVVETYLSRDGSPLLVCPVTEAHVGEGAVLDHHLLQLEGSDTSHVGVREILQARNSQMTSRVFAFGARLARHEITLRLEGEGAHGALEGLFCLTGHQHGDHHTLIEHAAPHASSQETYKGILDGSARGIFDGRIVVRPKAEKSDAHQVNRNLMLSSDARVDSKPQLEIYNNDVRCTHGSTTGRLSADALFYLRSRGLSEASARGLLTFAFASELVGRVKVPPLKTLLERRLLDWLPRSSGAEGGEAR